MGTPIGGSSKSLRPSNQLRRREKANGIVLEWHRSGINFTPLPRFLRKPRTEIVGAAPAGTAPEGSHGHIRVLASIDKNDCSFRRIEWASIPTRPNCRIIRLIAVRHRSLRVRVCIFVWTQKCTKKITAVKKRPNACLLSAEISQTRWRSNTRNFGRFVSTGVRAAVSSRPTCFPSASSRQTAQGSTSGD